MALPLLMGIGALAQGGANLMGVGGAIAGAAGAQSAAAGARRDVRRGIQQGYAQAERQAYDVMQSPEFQATRNFLLGTFGIPGGGGVGGAGGDFTLGGQTYEAGTAPTGFRLMGGAKQRATRVGRGLARAMRTGNERRLEKFAGKYENLSAAEQRYAVRALGERGYSREELTQSLLGTSFAPVGPGSTLGGPQMAAQTAAPGTPGYAPPASTVTSGASPLQPLFRDFVAGLGQAQASRGLYSSHAAASAEASGLAALNTQIQMQLLPQLLGLGSYGEELLGQFGPAAAGRYVFQNTGGQVAFGQPSPAGAYTGSPLAAGLGAGAVALSNIGQQLTGLGQFGQQADFQKQLLAAIQGGGAA